MGWRLKFSRSDQTTQKTSRSWLVIRQRSMGNFIYIAGQSSSNARLMKNVTLPNTSTSSRAVP
ncbi:hypothetical protein AB1Y54_09965, partial [Enterobacter hormaechei]|uniref:hypothetical protein n=1 Tax=Enterobacter hormaechei TaxID=158836 RepID=UPI002FD96740